MKEEIPNIGGVSLIELEEILKSESVYTVLRFASKSPSKSGVDECIDYDYHDLYNLVCKLRKNNNL